MYFSDQALRIEGEHAGQKTAQWRDAVALSDAQNGRVDVRGSGFYGLVSVGDRAAGVVVAVKLDVAAVMNHLANFAHQRIDLPGRGDPHGIGQAHPVHARLGHGPIHGHQVGFFAAESVFGTETHLHIRRGFDPSDHFLRLTR